MNNRRAFPRIPLEVAAELLLGEERVPSQTRNLSMGGVGLVVSQAVPEGGQLVVNLFLVEEGIEDATMPSLNVRTNVVWTAEVEPGKWEVGLRFVQLAPEQAQVIQLFLQRSGAT